MSPEPDAMPVEDFVKIAVVRGKALGFDAFRGFAPLSVLAKISKPDVYDQNSNPTGTQRDLKPKHAAEVHDYAANEEKAFFPEVVLNVRSWDDDNIYWEPLAEGEEEGPFGHLFINVPFFERESSVLISRIDGNHRLAYADGRDADYPAIEKYSSFCVLNVEDWDPTELKLFRDVNENPVRMSATHLYQAITRLFDENRLKDERPDIWMASQFNQDPKSAFRNKIYKGAGSKRGYLLKLNQLAGSIQECLQTSQKIEVLSDVSDQYRLILAFWNAVAENFPEAFAQPAKYVVLKSPGLIALGRVCGSLIDEGMATADIDENGVLIDKNFFMERLASAAEDHDWSTGGTFDGLQGKAGGQKIAKKVITTLAKKK